ncbi:MAG: glycosyltransferase family 4 protein [Bacteroidota bacterium]
MKSLKWYFVLPKMQDIPSGGNLYNAQLIGALRAKNIDLEVMDFEAYLEAREQGLRGLFWIDTLFLDQFGALPPLAEGPMIHGLLVHHLESLYPPKGIESDDWYAQNEADILARFEWFLATSPYTCKYLQFRGFASEQIVVAPPALSFQPVWREGDTEEVRALMVSNLVERKGVLPFLHGLAERFDRMGPFNLTIVGSDEIETDYAAACHELLDRYPQLQQKVLLTGSLLPRKTQRYYRYSNLYISTAYMETYGMSLQEARSFRLPILTLDGGNAASHVRHGSNGLVFGSIDNLLDEFQLLSQDPKRFESFHARAQQCCTEDAYDWHEVANRVLSALPTLSWKK